MPAPWRLLLHLFCLTTAGASVEMAFYLFAPYLRATGSPHMEALGWILGICYGFSACLRPLAGQLVERVGSRRTLCLGYGLVLGGAATVALGARFLPALLAGRALLGMGYSLTIVSSTTYQIAAVPPEALGRTLSLTAVGYTVPTLLVLPALEGLLRGGHTGLFLLFPPLFAGGALFLAWRLPPGEPPRARDAAPGTPFRDILKAPAFRTLFLAVVVFALTDAATMQISALALSKDLVASWFFLSQSLVALGTRLLALGFIDRFPRRRLVVLATGLSAGGLVLGTFAEGPRLFLAAGAVFGLGMGFGFPALMALIGDVAEPKLRPRVSALFWLFYSACFFVAPILIARGASLLDYDGALRLLGVLLCGSLLPLHRLLKRGDPAP